MNFPDMHRVRMSLPYFKEFGWEPEVICVDEKYVEGFKDIYLNLTVPADIIIHKIKALPITITKKFGLGSLSIRSFFHFKKKGNELLSKKKFDLIYFSTTSFHVCRLGPYWKKKFRIPFIIDIQDPWRNDYYLDKPKSQRPPKFFLSYNLDKYLEAGTIPKADGIISVSDGYCKMYIERYNHMREEQFKVIPFGASRLDFDVVEKNIERLGRLKFSPEKFNVAYIGRGGMDMHYALEIIFTGFKEGLKKYPHLFSKMHFSFIGTDYSSKGYKTIEPLAEKLNILDHVSEVAERIPYFESLYLLKEADMLVIPGSIDPSYSASKIYQYVLAEKPLLAVFNKASNVIDVLHKLNYDKVITFDNELSPDRYTADCTNKFYEILTNAGKKIHIDQETFKPYSSREKTKSQVLFFEEVVNKVTSKTRYDR